MLYSPAERGECNIKIILMIDIIIQDQNTIITPRLFEQIKIVSVIVRPVIKKFVSTKYDFHVKIGFIIPTKFLFS